MVEPRLLVRPAPLELRYWAAVARTWPKTMRAGCTANLIPFRGCSLIRRQLERLTYWIGCCVKHSRVRFFLLPVGSMELLSQPEHTYGFYIQLLFLR